MWSGMLLAWPSDGFSSNDESEKFVETLKNDEHPLMFE